MEASDRRVLTMLVSKYGTEEVIQAIKAGAPIPADFGLDMKLRFKGAWRIMFGW